jgi:hypothetical protein
MSLVPHPISQPTLDISPIWTPIIQEEAQFNIIWECSDFMLVPAKIPGVARDSIRDEGTREIYSGII